MTWMSFFLVQILSCLQIHTINNEYIIYYITSSNEKMKVFPLGSIKSCQLHKKQLLEHQNYE